jgi:uncharacterized protein
MPKKYIAPEDFFLDTAYVQALLNSRDQYHAKALELFPRVNAAREIWTTEFIIVEIADALSALARSEVLTYIDRIYSLKDQYRIAPLSKELMTQGMWLYRQRPDKEWGLTNYISFVVMREQGLIQALTSDQHYLQARFRALMLE